MRDLKATKYRLKAFLLRAGHSLRGPGQLERGPSPLAVEVVCPTPAQQIVFQEYVRAVTEQHARVQRLETELHEHVQDVALVPGGRGDPGRCAGSSSRAP